MRIHIRIRIFSYKNVLRILFGRLRDIKYHVVKIIIAAGIGSVSILKAN